MTISIVGVGGTLRGDSSSAKALRHCLGHAALRGAQTRLFTNDDLRLPLYEPGQLPSAAAQELIEALRSADGIILASPGYHGSISGTLKNVLDYTEEMAADPACYFEGRAIGCIVTAAGWQAAGSTLAALRSIVHALRGWPTPLGVTINSTEKVFGADGACLLPQVKGSLEAMTDQVLEFARMRSAGRSEAEAA